ncbi:MAG: response regulator [Thermodesulfobacteriota bacterium]
MLPKTKKKLLLVEDEMDMRFFLTTLLKNGGYQIVTARNGKEGLQKANTLQPDVILLDVMMPEEGGALMYQHLKSDPVLAPIPVVILSGVSKRSFLHYLKMLSAQTGVKIPPPQAYVEKPPEPTILLTILNGMFETGYQ